MLLHQVVVHPLVLDGLELAAGHGAQPARLPVELLHVDSQVFWIVGREGALLALDLLAQVFGIDVAGNVLGHLGGELTVPAMNVGISNSATF